MLHLLLWVFFHERTATSSMMHLWFLSILFLWDTYCMGSSCHYSCFIPGCLQTSLGLWLACWISKPGVGHDIVVILWFVKCFVMDCLNWRLLKYWQLWQNARWVSFCVWSLWDTTNMSELWTLLTLKETLSAHFQVHNFIFGLQLE